jgi:hypothetical protein
MARICYEVQEWIEEEIEQPIEEWVERTKEKCKEYPWWDPRGWVCWLVTTLVKVVTWVIVTIGKWVVRIVCEIVNVIITVIQEIFWRLVGILDLIGSLFGFRPEKFLRLKVFILTSEKTKLPVVDLSKVEEWVEFTKEVYSSKMNVSIRAADLRAVNEIVEIIPDPMPPEVLDVETGFFEYFGRPTGFLSSLEQYTHTSTWDYILDFVGYGEPIYIFVVNSLNGGNNSGFAYAISNIVILSSSANKRSMPHEIGHMCWLTHHSDERNIMYKDKNEIKDDFTSAQAAWARNSRFVTFFND